MGLTEEERKIALQYLYNGADFMFSGSSELKKLIMNNHPKTMDIEKNLKIFILEGKAIAVEPDLILKYCSKTLDENNEWLFDHGDIRVIPHKITLK